MTKSLVTGGKEVVLPFSRAPVVMKPVTHTEFIQMLRDQVSNTKRMPSSFGERIHSKPEYFEAHHHDGFLSKCFYFGAPTYARWDNGTRTTSECHVVLPVGDLTIVAALTSLKLWVGIVGKDEHWIWEWPENLPLCIDRIELAKQFDQLA